MQPGQEAEAAAAAAVVAAVAEPQTPALAQLRALARQADASTLGAGEAGGEGAGAALESRSTND